MSLFRKLELLDPYSSAFYYKETAISRPKVSPFLLPFCDDVLAVEEHKYHNLGYALDLLNPTPPLDLCSFPCPALSPLDFFESTSDLFLVERSPVFSTAAELRWVQEKAETEFCLKSLANRVTALEFGFERALELEPKPKPKPKPRDRKYKWTAEIKGTEKDGVDRKYKWVAEAKAGGEKNLKWMAEIKGKGKDAPSRAYTFQASTALAAGKIVEVEKMKKGKKNKGTATTTRLVEVSDPDPDQAAIFLKKAFAKRDSYSKGKRKDLSPQEAALIIQMSFRAHLIRRSQVLRGLRDLAVAKAKLKEIRALFSNFSYRRRIASDAEECQRFSEKIIVLLLTVDAIEGPDYLVRATRRSMVDELEAMLEIIDPQPPGRLGSLKRRRFDLPESAAIQKEMALGVAEVVQLLNQEDGVSNA